MSLESGEYRVRLNGLDLWFRVAGSGPTCVFPSPGWGPGFCLYSQTLQPLEKYFTVVYLDTRGSGQSAAPADPSHYRHDDLSADVDALREHLGQERIWLAGHSAGGWMAMHYAVTYPGRCAGLVLISSLYANDADWRQDAMARQKAREGEPWYDDAIWAIRDRGPSKDDESFTESVVAGLVFSFHDVANLDKLRAIAGRMSLGAFQGRLTAHPEGMMVLPLEQLDLPAVILVGVSDDRSSPRQAERIQQGIPNAKLFAIEDAGHFPWLEQPAAFFDALDCGLRSFGIDHAPVRPGE